MTRFAEGTEVPVERTRNEIERTLKRYGATGFAYGWEGAKATILFRMKERMLRFVILVPAIDDPEVRLTPTGRTRTAGAARSSCRRNIERQRWRALLLIVKAKLEAIESGIVTFEEEFLAQILLADGQTMGQWATPQLDEVYRTAKMPLLLPGGGP